MKIFKYTLFPTIREWQVVRASSVFRVLSAQMQGEWQIVLWAEVANELDDIDHHFIVVYTGDEVPDLAVHVATIQDGSIVKHVYKKRR